MCGMQRGTKAAMSNARNRAWKKSNAKTTQQQQQCVGCTGEQRQRSAMHATERRQKLTQKKHHNNNNVWDAQGNKGMTRERKREETEQSVYENWEDQETRGNSRNRQAGIKGTFTKNKADHDVSCGILDVVGAVAVGDTAKSPCSGTSERLHAGAGLVRI